MASNRKPCFFAKPTSPKKKGCDKPAKWRVLLGKGQFFDVCDEHKKGYEGAGLKIIPLEQKVEA